jgi:hypothetical protein
VVVLAGVSSLTKKISLSGIALMTLNVVLLAGVVSYAKTNIIKWKRQMTRIAFVAKLVVWIYSLPGPLDNHVH